LHFARVGFFLEKLSGILFHFSGVLI